ncbi:MAG: hemerythrin domain-containing protein [Candidatus Eisenbacteria bacterium]
MAERPGRSIEAALRDHHRLLALQTRLEGLLARDVVDDFAPWIAEVREEISGLVPLLEEHFGFEEAERLHEEIASRVPNATLRLDRLLLEHQEILRFARQLSALAGDTNDAERDLPMRAAAADFFSLLERHERAERELFLEALEGDGGSPD